MPVTVSGSFCLHPARHPYTLSVNILCTSPCGPQEELKRSRDQLTHEANDKGLVESKLALTEVRGMQLPDTSAAGRIWPRRKSPVCHLLRSSTEGIYCLSYTCTQCKEFPTCSKCDSTLALVPCLCPQDELDRQRSEQARLGACLDEYGSQIAAADAALAGVAVGARQRLGGLCSTMGKLERWVRGRAWQASMPRRADVWSCTCHSIHML